MVTYIKETIITKFTKLYSPPRKLKTGNKSPTLLLKKAFCSCDLSSAFKIFIERPVLLRKLPALHTAITKSTSYKVKHPWERNMK